MIGDGNGKDYQKVMDWLRFASLLILFLHIYYYCQSAFIALHLASTFTDRFLDALDQSGLFNSFHCSKWLTVILLTLSNFGSRGKKDEKLQLMAPFWWLIIGMGLFFGSAFLFHLALSPLETTIFYTILTLTGYLVILTGESLLSRILHQRLRKDIFNTGNESFPQQQRCITNNDSINLPIRYQFNGKAKKGWINIINPFRGMLIMGSPGSGKTWYIIQHIIRQQMEKGYTMFIYDYKYNDLTTIAYNTWLRNRNRYKIKPSFHVISFDDLERSDRCNPLNANDLTDIADATEAARSILLGLNTEWLSKQGDFWVESAIAFMTALIWYLRKYDQGQFCTVPHVIELMQIDYPRLLSILQIEPEIQSYIGSFIDAYRNNNMETLDNQLASLRISIARLSSPTLYYIMSGNDFTLDINNPKAPKICCIGSSPQRSAIYGAVISLYANTISRMANKKGMLKCSFIYDEFPTVAVLKVAETLATARSNRIVVTIAVQDVSQLRLNYGKNMAEVILNLPANILCGQAGNESAEFVSRRIGKNVQARSGLQINRNDTSFSQSEHLDMAIPAARIGKLSAGEFVGVLADNPDLPMTHKTFHGHIIHDNAALDKEHSGYKRPPLRRKITAAEVHTNYQQIKKDISLLVTHQLDHMLDTATLAHLVLTKKQIQH